MTNTASPSNIVGRAAIDAVECAWNAAAKSWDPAALVACYTEDAMLFGGRPGHAVGEAALRDYFGSYDGVIFSGTLSLVDQELRLIAPDVVLAQGFIDFAFVLAGNQTTRSHLRTTLVVLQHAGQWRIAQHHFSAVPAAPPLGQS